MVGVTLCVVGTLLVPPASAPVVTLCVVGADVCAAAAGTCVVVLDVSSCAGAEPLPAPLPLLWNGCDVDGELEPDVEVEPLPASCCGAVGAFVAGALPKSACGAAGCWVCAGELPTPVSA